MKAKGPTLELKVLGNTPTMERRAFTKSRPMTLPMHAELSNTQPLVCGILRIETLTSLRTLALRSTTISQWGVRALRAICMSLYCMYRSPYLNPATERIAHRSRVMPLEDLDAADLKGQQQRNKCRNESRCSLWFVAYSPINSCVGESG